MNPLEMFLRRHASEAVAVYDSRLNLTDANDSFDSFFPKSREKTLSKLFSEMVSGDDFFSQMMTVVEVENGIGECSLAWNSMGNRWEFKVSLIGFDDGEEKGYVCSFRDVTEFLFVQKVLMHRSDSLERLDRNSPVGVFKAAVGGSILYVNDGLVSMLGYESEHQIFNLELSATWVDTEDRNALLDNLKRDLVVNGFETRWKRRNGEVFWVSLTATAQQDRAGNLMYIEVVALDIDEKKQAENELKRLQNRLQSIIDEKTNELKRANNLLLKEVAERQKAESIYAVLHAIAEETAKTVSLRDLLEFIHHQLSRIIHTPNLYFAFYNGQSDTYTFPYSIDKKDGIEDFIGSESMKGSLTEYVRATGKPVLIDNKEYIRLVEQGILRSIGSPSEQWMGVPLRDSDGVWGVLAVQSYDMKSVFSEKDLVLLAGLADSVSMAVGRFRAEQNRKRIESLYNTVVDNLQQGVIMCDPYDRILFANEAFSKIVGVPARELEGTDFHNLIPERDKGKTANVRESRALGECSSYQISLIRFDGEKVPVSISGVPRFEETGTFIGTVGLFDLIEEGEHLLE